MSFTLGNLPKRVQGFHGDVLDNYFRVARGRSAQAAEEHAACCGGVSAGEMTKWFDTNYHYIVPEFRADTKFTLDPSRLLEQLAEAQAQGVTSEAGDHRSGDVSVARQGKDDSDKLALLPRLLPCTRSCSTRWPRKASNGCRSTSRCSSPNSTPSGGRRSRTAYAALEQRRVKLLLATYFGQLRRTLPPCCANCRWHGLHLDAVNARDEVDACLRELPAERVLSLGVINGRNIWKTRSGRARSTGSSRCATSLASACGSRRRARCCTCRSISRSEQKLDAELKSWLAFALQKLDEVAGAGDAR